jgi:hypothetical protein
MTVFFRVATLKKSTKTLAKSLDRVVTIADCSCYLILAFSKSKWIYQATIKTIKNAKSLFLQGF